MAWSVTAAATLLSAAWIGVWMLRMARDIRRDARFPPHGVRLLAHAPVLVGEDALRRARMVEVLGLLILVADGVMAAVAWGLHSMLVP